MNRRHPRSTLFPTPTLFRSGVERPALDRQAQGILAAGRRADRLDLDARDAEDVLEPLVQAERREPADDVRRRLGRRASGRRSEEHTSELQSRQYLVCRLLLE